MNPLQRYQHGIATGQVSFDESQQQALSELNQLHHQLNKAVDQAPILGLYLWGKVGRGKTLLMDSFVESFDKGVCLRQHFHHFMQNVHHQLKELSGSREPLKKIAKQLRLRHQVLCFDEFFVSDIGDAMLLGRLIMYLFEQNMVVVVTSNCAPSELYKDGLQRVNFLPAINAINQNMKIVELAGNKDHRERQLHTVQNYFVISASNADSGHNNTVNKALLADLFERYNLPAESSVCLTKLHCQKPHKTSGTLSVLGRDIHYLAINKKSIVFDFKDICLGPRSHFDYIELAKQFNTVFLMNVPVLGGEMVEHIKARGTEDGSTGSGNTGEREVLLSPMDDGARRFIALIDELYDQRVNLYLTCDVELKQLYTHGSLAFQFERARSRLIEMGSEEYMSRKEKPST
jgi:cell division protein ZapE